jgi:hypothetical protein
MPKKASKASVDEQVTKIKTQVKKKIKQELEKRDIDVDKLKDQSSRMLAGGALTGTLLISAPASPKTLPPATPQQKLASAGIVKMSQFSLNLTEKLAGLIPKRIGHLEPSNEEKVRKIIKEVLGISATSTLEDQRLNHSLGWIGYEQHLRRYPGDTLSQHDEFLSAGIAPNRGAWGYFASSQAEMTDKLTNYEKYYVAVQTLYLPTWEKDLKFLQNWYKHRKVLVLNPNNGTAVVAVIADAGPAEWTGKQFGGSPEVMHHLGLAGGMRKGKVLLLFVDDPHDQVPVGPVTSRLDLGPAQVT